MHPNKTVVYGIFYALKPFYLRAALQKEMVSCLGKIHLHTRRAVDTLVKLCVQQDIDINLDSYMSSSEYRQMNSLKSNLLTY